jgi:hypothetical protein
MVKKDKFLGFHNGCWSSAGLLLDFCKSSTFWRNILRASAGWLVWFKWMLYGQPNTLKVSCIWNSASFISIKYWLEPFQSLWRWRQYIYPDVVCFNHILQKLKRRLSFDREEYLTRFWLEHGWPCSVHLALWKPEIHCCVHYSCPEADEYSTLPRHWECLSFSFKGLSESLFCTV